MQKTVINFSSAWGKVIFLHLSVILFTGGGSNWAGNPLGRYTPWVGTPPQDLVQPPGQVHHLVPGTPPNPWDQVHPPWTRYTLRGQVHPLGPGIPSQTRYTTQD